MVDCSPEASDPLSYLDFKPTNSKWEKYRQDSETQSPACSEETRNLRQITAEIALLHSEPEEAKDRIEFYVDENCISEKEGDDIRRIALGDFQYSHGPEFPREFLSALSGGLIGRLVRWIILNSNRPQVVLALLASMTMVAVLISRRLKTSHDDRPNVYNFGLAPSGAGKDAARQLTRWVLSKAGASECLSPETVTSSAALMNAVQKSPALLVQFDEAGHIFRSMRGPKADPMQGEMEALLLRLTGSSGSPEFCDKGYSDAERNRIVSFPCVSAYFTATPASIIGALDANSVTEGLLGRMTLYLERNIPDSRSVEKTPPPDDIVQPVREWFEYKPTETVWEDSPRERVVPFSSDALESFELASLRWDILSGTVSEEHGASSWRRCLEKAKKKALIICASDHLPSDETIVVERRHAELAIAMEHYFTLSALTTIRSHISSTKRERDIDEVKAYLKSRKGQTTTPRDLSNRFRKWDRKYRQEILNDLIECSIVKTEEVATSGRPRSELSLVS